MHGRLKYQLSDRPIRILCAIGLRMFVILSCYNRKSTEHIPWSRLFVRLSVCPRPTYKLTLDRLAAAESFNSVNHAVLLI